MNYEEIFNLAYSNSISESIQDPLLDLIAENYVVEDEAYMYEPLLNFLDYLTSTSITEAHIDNVIDVTFGALSEDVINEVSDEYIRQKAKNAIKTREKAFKAAQLANKYASGSSKVAAEKAEAEAEGALEKAKRYATAKNPYADKRNMFVKDIEPETGQYRIRPYNREGSKASVALARLKGAVHKVWNKTKGIAGKVGSKAMEIGSAAKNKAVEVAGKAKEGAIKAKDAAIDKAVSGLQGLKTDYRKPGMEDVVSSKGEKAGSKEQVLATKAYSPSKPVSTSGNINVKTSTISAPKKEEIEGAKPEIMNAVKNKTEKAPTTKKSKITTAKADEQPVSPALVKKNGGRKKAANQDQLQLGI